MSFKIKSFPPYMELWILIDNQDPGREYIGKNNGRVPLLGGIYYLSRHDAELDMCIAVLEGKDVKIQRLLWPTQPGWPEE